MEPDSKTPGKKRRIGSVHVGFRLVHALEESGRPMSLTELAKAAGMPSSQAHLYLVSFVQEGLIWQDPSTSHYQLGPYAIRLGMAAIRSMDVLSFTKDALIDLVRETHESAYCAIWTEHGPVIVQKIDGGRLIPVSIRVGHVMPLLTSATGRIFLSFLPRAQTWPIVRKELAARRKLEKPAGMQIANEADVEALIEGIRAAGIAQTDSLLFAGFVGISAPILDHDDEICCSVTLMGPQVGFDVSTDGSAAGALRRHADALCARLGAKKPSPPPIRTAALSKAGRP